MTILFYVGLIIGSIIFLDIIFDPKLDKLSDGTRILWFDGGAYRHYIKLW